MERKVCTIGEWLDVWYEVYAVPEYAPKTLEIYRDARKRLIENGSDAKSLALIIGHSNPAFTLRRYVHPDHTSLYEQMCRLSSIQQ